VRLVRTCTCMHAHSRYFEDELWPMGKLEKEANGSWPLVYTSYLVDQQGTGGSNVQGLIIQDTDKRH
jgi:hypothetical protein